MIEMSEQSLQIKAALDEGMDVIQTKVRNYFVGSSFQVVLADIDDLEYRAEIQDKTRASHETGQAAHRGNENLFRSNCQFP